MMIWTAQSGRYSLSIQSRCKSRQRTNGIEGKRRFIKGEKELIRWSTVSDQKGFHRHASDGRTASTTIGAGKTIMVPNHGGMRSAEICSALGRATAHQRGRYGTIMWMVHRARVEHLSAEYVEGLGEIKSGGGTWGR